MFDYKRSEFAIERYRFEQWACHCERDNAAATGLGRSWLARWMDYNARIQGSSHHIPLDGTDPVQVVTELMETLRISAPEIHSALLARHRRFIRGELVQPIYDRGRYRIPERLLATILYGDPSQGAVQRLRRLCFKGYELLRPRLLPLAKRAPLRHYGASF